LDQRAETNASAPLTKTFKKDWARGQATTPKVLQYARDAKLSGAANLGSLAEETTGKNNFRKMKRAAGPTAIPRTYIEIPKGGSGFLYPHPVNDPVDAFCRAIKDDEKKLHRFGADLDQQVPDFWENISGADLFTAIAANVDVSASLPGWIHGDGAPTNKVDGLFTISWGCTLARGPTATSRFIYTVRKESLITDGTLERLFDHLAFRMNVLVTGKEPERLWNGRKNPKAGQDIDSDGWKFASIFLKGDWEFLGNIIHLPRWDNCNNMCSDCGASNSDQKLRWTRAGADGWRSTKRDHK
jgi:hypothetical protein